MKDFGRGVINALEGVAKLEWFRYPVLKPEQIEFVLPVAVWRFDKNTADDHLENRLISCLTSLLENYNGNFPWSLSEVGRNWILQPLLIKKLQDSGAFKHEEEVRDPLINNPFRDRYPRAGQSAAVRPVLGSTDLFKRFGGGFPRRIHTQDAPLPCMANNGLRAIIRLARPNKLNN